MRWKTIGIVLFVLWAGYVTYRLEELRHFWIAYYCGAGNGGPSPTGFGLAGDFLGYSCPPPMIAAKSATHRLKSGH
jgi:hypothetical protein